MYSIADIQYFRNLLIIDGPSASGKSTIMEGLLSDEQLSLELIRRYSTRSKRDNEMDEYVFVDKERFQVMIENEEFIEWKCYKFGMCYGLPVMPIAEKLRQGHNTIALINTGNIESVKRLFPNSLGVFLRVSEDTIRKRLESRCVHTEAQVAERLENARRAYSVAEKYDKIVDNDQKELDSVISEIKTSFLDHLKVNINEEQSIK